uniref:Uncharacterized protein n=1 Tax=Rhizophora mucronata TaxID=61149 RepID=A0A2P2Q190_RHIMU
MNHAVNRENIRKKEMPKGSPESSCLNFFFHS